jgi:hypothetical protein
MGATIELIQATGEPSSLVLEYEKGGKRPPYADLWVPPGEEPSFSVLQDKISRNLFSVLAYLPQARETATDTMTRAEYAVVLPPPGSSGGFIAVHGLARIFWRSNAVHGGLGVAHKRQLRPSAALGNLAEALNALNAGKHFSSGAHHWNAGNIRGRML